MPRYARGFDTDAAFAHLVRADRKLGAWMKRIGPLPPDPNWRKPVDPVDAMAREILYQQLCGTARPAPRETQRCSRFFTGSSE